MRLTRDEAYGDHIGRTGFGRDDLLSSRYGHGQSALRVVTMRHGNPPGRRCVGRTWKRIQAQVYEASGGVCWLDGEPVDWSAPPRHPRAPSVDHVIPQSLGGSQLDLANLRLAHYGCNAARGNRLTPQRKAGSRAW